jgi:disulfide bond formation protein DsbB
MKILNLYHQGKWFCDWTLIIFWMISCAFLAFSFHHQYVQKIEPCALCKWQRFVYFLIFAITPIGFVQHLNLPIKIALNFIFLAGFFLAGYHTLVQFDWIADRCAITQKIENMDAFIKMLEEPKVSCSNIGWKLFGISASIYNAIFSLIAALFLNIKISHQSKSWLKSIALSKYPSSKTESSTPFT